MIYVYILLHTLSYNGNVFDNFVYKWNLLNYKIKQFMNNYIFNNMFIV